MNLQFSALFDGDRWSLIIIANRLQRPNWHYAASLTIRLIASFLWNFPFTLGQLRRQDDKDKLSGRFLWQMTPSNPIEIEHIQT